MSPRKSHSAFPPNYDHRRDSPPPSSPTHSRRRRSPVRYSGNRGTMQASTQSYPQDALHQRNGRGSIILPPGKNDLEILENLKQIIKNGQHEFYRAIPQPAALASLYLGTIPTGEPASNTVEDTRSTSVIQDDISKEHTSPVESTTRPPRLKGKESWESGSFRRTSLSKAEEAVTNGFHKEGSEDRLTPSTAAHQPSSEFVPPSHSGVDVVPPNGPMLTPPNDSRPPTRDRTDTIPASDDSSTAVATSPAKAVSSPMSQVETQDRDRNYNSRNEPNGYSQPTSYSHGDKREDSVGGRYHRDSYAKPDDRYPSRDADNNWPPHSQQRPYRSNYDASSRPYVKTEEAPISLSDLDSRTPFPPAGSRSAPSQNPPRNGNAPAERTFIDISGSASSDTHGLPPGLLGAAQPNAQYDSDRPAYNVAASNAMKSEQDPRDSRGAVPQSSTSADQNGRSAPSHSDPVRMPPPSKGNTYNRYTPRPSDRYNRPGSPGYTGNSSRPPIVDRTDNRGPPPRDYRPPPAPPKSISRERDYRPPPSNNYRPEYEDRKPVERIDVDNDPRFNDQRQYRGFSPPTAAEMARDRQRQMNNRVPPSPRTTTSDLAYESPSTRRYNGPPPSAGGGPPHSTTERDWYPPPPAQPAGSYHASQRWEDDPYYPPRDRPANWDAPTDRGRYEPEAPPRRWEDRPDRDVREPYRAPPPASAPASDRYVDRGRPPPPVAHGPPAYSRVRPRSPSPIRTDSRPPMKRQRDDYPGPPPLPSASSDYYSPHAPTLGPRDSARGRPNDSYHTGGGGRPASPLGPPPSSGSTSFYDRSGPPPSTASSAMSVDRDRLADRGREQDRNRGPPPRDYMPPPRPRDPVEEYHPREPSLSRNAPSGGSMYDRPRTPPGGRTSMPPPPVGGGGAPGNRTTPVSSGGYRDGYRGPPRDGRYMPPPQSRP